MDAFDRLAEKPILHGPAQQHYLSRFYLQGFAENRRVAVYDRTDGAVNSLPPKRVAALEHFYTFIDNQDRQRFELEAVFGIVESRAGSILKSVVSRLPITSLDREYLSLFIAMHAVRTPAALAESRIVREKAERARWKLTVPDKRAAYAWVKDWKPETPEDELRDLADKLFEMISGDHFRINVPDEAARATSLQTWNIVAEAIFERDWVVMHAPPGTDFITSDSPVVLISRPGTDDLPTSYRSPHASVFFPLSRKALLGMSGAERTIVHADATAVQVERFNRPIAGDCYRYLIGSSADLVRSAAEHLDLMGTAWAPRVEVGVAVPPGEAHPAIFIKGLARRPIVDLRSDERSESVAQ
ncbi:DUF4238 domain-containing protein [Ideonella sp. YS5]|uniref:DUF4238 domain-containing protein n=1 Tax=Ideonella sp. YS5 TaxID=3453714 RepID=UPI003EEA2AF8